MTTSLGRLSVMLVDVLITMLAASLLAACGAATGSPTTLDPSSPQRLPPEWIADYVERVTEQYGQTVLVEWVKLPSEPEVRDLNGGVMVGRKLLDEGARPIGLGWMLFVDFAGIPAPLGCYVVAAQGSFAARVDRHGAPVPGRTVLLLLDAARVGGHDTLRMADVGVYRDSVHLHLAGTSVYWEGMRMTHVPIDWHPGPH